MAQLTLVWDDSLTSRISTAFGDALALGRTATQNEVKAYLQNTMKGVVQNYEFQIQRDAMQPPAPIDVT